MFSNFTNCYSFTSSISRVLSFLFPSLAEDRNSPLKRVFLQSLSLNSLQSSLNGSSGSFESLGFSSWTSNFGTFFSTKRVGHVKFYLFIAFILPSIFWRCGESLNFAIPLLQLVFFLFLLSFFIFEQNKVQIELVLLFICVDFALFICTHDW